ncbi:nicotinate-nucleotide adenylyltransferase [Georgenia sp. EYE_87]|uniref:nicotinate-nucleotide adenylyltransferase n=1 Tax=Georgenia sp. EYE_87 TaxID=2853448 RepID=UPI00249F288D|nr:nicotinate-nucleotide adenylyltransferase [Georgenia sp. EYE_87]MCK6211499.1 nicotinate-nucleotide adenylyltransferase [Georgenia sp. EYE_87]
MAWGPRPRRRVGVMGGTFDPVHHGHLVAASEVLESFALDEVIFVPTGEQPFKTDRDVTQAEHRYLMTVVATASNPRFTVSRLEIDRPGKTYTIDTLRELKAQMPDTDLYFITGADVLPQILTWKDADELWSLAHFIGVTRPGHELDTSGLPEAGVSLLEVPAMAISSTDCRGRVAAGKPVWYLVPDGVVQYIAKYGLYRKGSAKVDDFSRPRPRMTTRARDERSVSLPPRAVGAGK